MSQSSMAPRFPCLDEYRSLAALGIMLMHVEQMKELQGYPGYFQRLAPLNMMVTFFFVLSGFLITYLLLTERQRQGTVALRLFYVRRALRIWPVYYVIVFLGLVILPHVGPLAIPELSARVATAWTQKFLLFLALLPNLAFVVYPVVPYASHTWSIGVEEQFYLTWPLLFKFVRRPLLGMLAVIAGLVLVRGAISHNSETSTLIEFLNGFRIDCMAIGGVGAYSLFHNRTGVLAVIYSRVTQVAALVVVVLVLIRTLPVSFYIIGVEALAFCCIIVNAASNPRSFFSLNSSWLARLGKWSYGIYMYHPPVIGLCLWLLGGLLKLNLERIDATLLLHGSCMVLTVGIAGFSYRYFETSFMKRKPVSTMTARLECSQTPQAA